MFLDDTSVMFLDDTGGGGPDHTDRGPRRRRFVDVCLCEDQRTVMALLFEHEDSDEPIRGLSWRLPATIAEDNFDHAAAIAEAESRLLGRGVVLKARPPRS